MNVKMPIFYMLQTILLMVVLSITQFNVYIDIAYPFKLLLTLTMNKSHISTAPNQKHIDEDDDDEQTIQDKM